MCVSVAYFMWLPIVSAHLDRDESQLLLGPLVGPY